MNKNNDCKIIQDLLPSYVDNLTSIESSNFIEEHIIHCKECSVILNNMKKELEKSKNNSKKEIMYAKKYNRKLNFLVIVIVFILLAVLFATFVRNAIIISDLIKKSKQYNECQNFHSKESIFTDEGITIYETYFKNGKYIQTRYSYHINQIDKQDYSFKAIDYYDGMGTLTEYYTNEKKYIKQYEKNNLDYFITHPINISNLQELEGNWKEFIKACFNYNITTEKCNGKECYRFNFDSNSMGVYIDKATGLIVRNEYLDINNNLDTTYDIQFEFYNVTDNDLLEPDISEYTIIQENN